MEAPNIRQGSRLCKWTVRMVLVHVVQSCNWRGGDQADTFLTVTGKLGIIAKSLFCLASGSLLTPTSRGKKLERKVILLQCDMLQQLQDYEFLESYPCLQGPRWSTRPGPAGCW